MDRNRTPCAQMRGADGFQFSCILVEMEGFKVVSVSSSRRDEPAHTTRVVVHSTEIIVTWIRSILRDILRHLRVQSVPSVRTGSATTPKCGKLNVFTFGDAPVSNRVGDIDVM
jgi:hypothetical protein